MTILNLVTDYLGAVEQCLALFEKKFERRDLVRAWREGIVPQTGEISPGIQYQTHGVGCAVEFLDHEVDFDFANQHEVGFDAWRLWVYARQFPDKYPGFQKRNSIEVALANSISEGAIIHAEDGYAGESNDRLFRLRNSARLAESAAR